MLTVNEYRDTLLEEFYLDSDDNTVRRKKDGWRGKFFKDDVVIPFKMHKLGYLGVHIPRTRATISYPHLLTLLRGIDIPEGCVIDHINGDYLNNTKENLRVVTTAINTRNSKMKKNNTSGYTGISYDKKAKLYTIRKYYNGKRVYKSARTLEEAIVILKEMEKELIANHGYSERHGK